MADVALWLGPYMSISSKNVICTKTQKVRKCRQITTNQNHTNQPTRKSPSQICVSSKKNSKPDTQKGQEPKQKHPQRGFAKGHSGLTTASRSKTCQNELSTTTFSETWKSKHRAHTFVSIEVKNCTWSRAYKIASLSVLSDVLVQKATMQRT